MGSGIKSKNTGGKFRINLSKSVTEYIWDKEEAQLTKEEHDETRDIYTIQETDDIYTIQEADIPYDEETGRKKRGKSNASHSFATEAYDTPTVKNDVTYSVVTDDLEEMLASASTRLRISKLILAALIVSLIIGCSLEIIWIISLVLLIVLLFYRKTQAIELQYTIEDDLKPDIDKAMHQFIEIAESDMAWNYSGPTNRIKREKCKTSTKIPFPFTTDFPVATFKIGKQTVAFLPDTVLVFKRAKIKAIKYDDIEFSLTTTRFVEAEKLPADATVVDFTWRHAKSHGGRHKRHNDYRQVPVCLYGELTAKSASGLNMAIMFSKPPSE